MISSELQKRTNPPPHTRGRILVVDDEVAIGIAFSRILTAAGFETERADNGLSATARLQESSFDAIVSDIAMPQMDGIALLKVARERDLDVPVLLVTGEPRVDTALKAIEYGALRYLCKPISLAELVAEVDKAVRLGRMARLKRQALELVGDSSMQLGDRAGLEVCFSRALKALWTAYQPIVCYSERRVVAFEALMRSHEPKLPHPEAMLNAADRLGKLDDLGRAVRRAVGDDMATAEIPQVFVNLHPLDLLDEDLFAPNSPLCLIAPKVVLEITERASLDDITDVKTQVARLRRLGFRIAIDDMGAGYAGLNSIAQLEPEVMKIDMTLVRNIDREPTKRKLVAAMTGLCREMNVQVIAEGIETCAERDVLAELGCDLMQGFLFSKPGRPFPEVHF